MSTNPKSPRERRRNSGFLITAAGALLGFISCALTLINPVPALYDFILYGATSVAILLVFAGLYLILE